MTAPPQDAGYRREPLSGPRLRSDVIDVYVVQQSPRPPAKLAASKRPTSSMDSDTVGGAEPAVYLLQVLRAGPPLANTWHPVMGHAERGETAVQCARRELDEELGLRRGDPALLGLYALEQVHPFFIAELDAIVLSPRFAVEVAPGWQPVLNDEHTDYRWVSSRDVAELFTWPGQIAACREITASLLSRDSLMRPLVVIN